MSPDQYNNQILTALLQLQRDVAEIKTAVQRGGASNGTGSAPRGGGSGSGPAEGAIADDRDLDGQHGDPTIKFDPKEKYWRGASYVGYRFSETEPDYLDAMAKYLDACAYMAEQDADEKKRRGAVYKRKDAARARGWAARLRNGWGSGGHSNGARGGHANGGGYGGGSPAGSYDQHAGAFNNGSNLDDDVPF
jgi:hypothetical protein